MAIIEAIVAIVIIIVVVLGVIRALFPPQTTSPRCVEADSLLKELHIINALLPILPAEFKNKLDKYIGGK